LVFKCIKADSSKETYQGNVPLPEGYVIGHEPMAIVEEVGSEVTKEELSMDL
jgi:Zn-dependent alcohol dehydrogenase